MVTGWGPIRQRTPSNASGNCVIAAKVLELARGRYQDALAAFRAAERLAGNLAAPHLLLPPTRGLLLHLLVRLGEIECAEQALAELGEPDRERGETRTAVERARALGLLAPLARRR